MSSLERAGSTVDALIAASKHEHIRTLVVSAQLTGVAGFRLLPGQSLRGADDHASLTFVEGGDGLQLSSDNEVSRIRLNAAPDKRAIFNDTDVEALGRIALRNVMTNGRVQILARDKVGAGHVDVHGLDIVAADARAESERPQGYGVHVLQGAFTLWNMQKDAAVNITADLTSLSAGRPGAPVRGGGIKPGTPDQITGGIRTNGRGVAPIEQHGAIDSLRVSGGFVAAGGGFDKI